MPPNVFLPQVVCSCPTPWARVWLCNVALGVALWTILGSSLPSTLYAQTTAPVSPSPSVAPPGAPSRVEAPWEKLGETPVLTLYMDRSTLQREGAIRRVIEMQDLKVPDPDGVLSRRYVNEYDCDNQMHRIGRMTSWSGAALTGKKLFDVTDWGYWRKIPPNGLFTLGYKMLCPPRAGESLSR